MTRRGFLSSLFAAAMAAVGRPAAKPIHRIGEAIYVRRPIRYAPATAPIIHRIPDPFPMTIRTVRAYSVDQDRWITRIDVLYGIGDVQRRYNEMLSSLADSVPLAPTTVRLAQ